MIRITLFLSLFLFLSGKPAKIESLLEMSAVSSRPNLLIIHTDEHNLRTLGCYRETMSEEQAYMWGRDAIVETPYIDQLAKEGVLCANWYATSPVCTPSRASMISGLYPEATGSPSNNRPLRDEVITFAQILKDNGYATSYVGKWHLDGDAKPGWAPERKFGFEDNRYMFNRGHWKILADDENGPRVDQEGNQNGSYSFSVNKATEKSFTTDFLIDRALEIIQRDRKQGFAIMISIPDPHGPNQVRAPYDTMYDHIHFEEPRTMHPDPDRAPKWLGIENNKNRALKLNQTQMADYFGMVKCIDDNVGRILNYLKAEGLDNNTIVVFTSDHGDLMGEHGKHNKGLPYEMSARVPFLIKYPGTTVMGKQIEKAYSMADFTPTILGLMGVDHSAYSFHGEDASTDFMRDGPVQNDERIVYITNAADRWEAVVNKSYKLVTSPTDEPWLFDLKKDPDEEINFYNNPEYKEITGVFMEELLSQMERFKKQYQ